MVRTSASKQPLPVDAVELTEKPQPAEAALVAPFHHITVHPAPAPRRYLPILSPGTAVKVLSVTGWSLNLARVLKDDGPEKQSDRRISIVKVYFNEAGQELKDVQFADTITLRRDRVTLATD